jgi:PPPDE putative peptidase domain
MVMTTHSTVVQDDGRRHNVRHAEDGEYVIPPPSGSTNDIKLHIYDLISKDTLMALPFGCVCEIGKCFNDVNTALHELGTGAYHVGLEINGVEYAYGATSSPGRSGVFSCIPTLSPGYQFRTTIDFGKRLLIRKAWVLVTRSDETRKPVTSFQQRVEYVDGRDIIKGMAHEYMGIDYDILRRNCCTFARDACLRLGIEEREIPSWFRNLAESGAMTQDLARATVLPLTKVLSSDRSMLESDVGSDFEFDDEDSGFEIVARRNSAGRRDLLVVMVTP